MSASGLTARPLWDVIRGSAHVPLRHLGSGAGRSRRRTRGRREGVLLPAAATAMAAPAPASSLSSRARRSWAPRWRTGAAGSMLPGGCRRPLHARLAGGSLAPMRWPASCPLPPPPLDPRRPRALTLGFCDERLRALRARREHVRPLPGELRGPPGSRREGRAYRLDPATEATGGHFEKAAPTA